MCKNIYYIYNIYLYYLISMLIYLTSEFINKDIIDTIINGVINLLFINVQSL